MRAIFNKPVLVLLLLLFAATLLSYSQKSRFPLNVHTRFFTVREGLSQSQVFALCQAKNGDLWVGTNGGGINIYNGLGFRILSTEQGLAGNRIYGIFEDSKGKMWVGTNKGVSVVSKNGVVNYGEKEGLLDDIVYKIASDSSGTIWLATKKGVFTWNGKAFIKLKGSAILEEATVISMLIGKDGGAWFGSKEQGLFKLESSGKITQYTKEQGIANNSVWTINYDADGMLIIGTEAGLSALTDTGFVSRLNNTYTAAFNGPGNELWMFAYFGMYKSLNGKRDILDSNYTKYYLADYKIRAAIRDREGSLWIGTETGLLQVPQTAFINYSENTGLSNKNVFAVCEGSGPGEIWIGSLGGGATLLVERPNSTPHYDYLSSLLSQVKTTKPKDLTKIKGLTGYGVFDIMRDRRGRMWFGTTNGISIFNPADSTFIHFSNDSALEDLGVRIVGDVPLKYVNCFWEDNFGRVYAGSLTGLALLTDSTIENIGLKIPELGKKNVVCLYQDEKSRLWICTMDGLLMYDGTKTTKYGKEEGFIDGQVSAVVQDNEGNFWFATKEGVFRYDGKKFIRLSKSDGLISDNVYIIQFDTHQNLFIGTSQGVDRLDVALYNTRKEISIKHYGTEEGFLGLECNRNAGMMDFKGRIWFGTIDGVSVYDPESDLLNQIAPFTTLNKVLYNFQDFDWTPYCSGFDENGLPVNLELPYNKNHITFEFAGNSLAIPSKVRYQYKMVGIDEDWGPAMNKSEADYPVLPPGKYTFMVRASNNDGVWSEQPVSFSFVITPPFYQTWWFISIVVVAGIVLIIVYMKYREAALKKDKIRLENTVKERTAEVVKQKEIVEQKNKDITDSINYAKNIQVALLPRKDEIMHKLQESFVLYRPRDIVSGDFYWVSNKGNRTYLAIADSTGHGVPGAFMSMLGTAFLDEIVGNNPVIPTNELLGELRDNVIESLRQTGKEGESKDGMDICLIAVDWEQKMIEYSGANNPLYLVRNNILNEYKADKMPIGFHINQSPFTINKISIFPGDTLYLFTDGYADQFGGPQNRKFKYKPLKEKLVQISLLPMDDQEKVLSRFFDEWKGSNPQVDDVLLAGIHFGKKTMGIS